MRRCTRRFDRQLLQRSGAPARRRRKVDTAVMQIASQAQPSAPAASTSRQVMHAQVHARQRHQRHHAGSRRHAITRRARGRGRAGGAPDSRPAGRRTRWRRPCGRWGSCRSCRVSKGSSKLGPGALEHVLQHDVQQHAARHRDQGQRPASNAPAAPEPQRQQRAPCTLAPTMPFQCVTNSMARVKPGVARAWNQCASRTSSRVMAVALDDVLGDGAEGQAAQQDQDQAEVRCRPAAPSGEKRAARKRRQRREDCSECADMGTLAKKPQF